MIYFDSAATTLQKPPAVSNAVAQAVRSCASPGRGDYPAARRAEEILFRCRTELAELFDVPGPEREVFTLNATHEAAEKSAGRIQQIHCHPQRSWLSF